MVDGMTLKYDFDVLVEGLTSFFSEKNTKEKMSGFLRKDTNDWEKWLQIELEYHLEFHHNHVVKREVMAKADGRSKSGRLHMYVDLLIRKRMTRKDHYMYVELKVDNSPTEVLDSLIEDSNKLGTIVNSHFDITNQKLRSYWCVGFYQQHSPKLKAKVDKILKENFAPYYPVFHDEINLCKCRGSNHQGDCKKLGMIII